MGHMQLHTHYYANMHTEAYHARHGTITYMYLCRASWSIAEAVSCRVQCHVLWGIA